MHPGLDRMLFRRSSCSIQKIDCLSMGSCLSPYLYVLNSILFILIDMDENIRACQGGKPNLSKTLLMVDAVFYLIL